ncbi:MAG: hypothetical protein AABW51_02245 [Nanoarchaeota archaeon]
MVKRRLMMLYNKKGLSTIVTTLIIILLVLVAIGIIWVVIRGVIEQGTSQIDINTRCINTDVRATAVSCTGPLNQSCTLDVTRKAGTDALGGVKAVFHNTTAGTSSNVTDIYSGDLTLLSTRTFGGVSVVPVVAPNSVDIIPYFKDAQGQPRLCTQINTFSF